jgi:hypothetical protein
MLADSHVSYRPEILGPGEADRVLNVATTELRLQGPCVMAGIGEGEAGRERKTRETITVPFLIGPEGDVK